MVSRFERTLYRRPDSDADSLWRALTERYLEVESPEPSLWASETPLLVQPLSAARYLVAEAAAAQLLAALHARFGSAEGGQVGKFLEQSVYSPSAGRPWTEILTRATGAPLGASSLVRELSAP